MSKFVRIDNCAFTKVPSLIKSAVADEDIENGTLVAVGKLKSGEREIHEYATPEETDTLIGVVCTPEVEYDEKGYKGIDTFINKKGDAIRIGILQKGDILSIGNDTTTTDITAGTIKAEYQATEISGRFSYKVLEVK